jgi:hypothetical protein
MPVHAHTPIAQSSCGGGAGARSHDNSGTPSLKTWEVADSNIELTAAATPATPVTLLSPWHTVAATTAERADSLLPAPTNGATLEVSTAHTSLHSNKCHTTRISCAAAEDADDLKQGLPQQQCPPAGRSSHNVQDTTSARTAPPPHTHPCNLYEHILGKCVSATSRAMCPTCICSCQPTVPVEAEADAWRTHNSRSRHATVPLLPLPSLPLLSWLSCCPAAPMGSQRAQFLRLHPAGPLSQRRQHCRHRWSDRQAAPPACRPRRRRRCAGRRRRQRQRQHPQGGAALRAARPRPPRPR